MKCFSVDRVERVARAGALWADEGEGQREDPYDHPQGLLGAVPLAMGWSGW